MTFKHLLKDAIQRRVELAKMQQFLIDAYQASKEERFLDSSEYTDKEIDLADRNLDTLISLVDEWHKMKGFLECSKT